MRTIEMKILFERTRDVFIETRLRKNVNRCFTTERKITNDLMGSLAFVNESETIVKVRSNENFYWDDRSIVDSRTTKTNTKSRKVKESFKKKYSERKKNEPCQGRLFFRVWCSRENILRGVVDVSWGFLSCVDGWKTIKFVGVLFGFNCWSKS